MQWPTVTNKKQMEVTKPKHVPGCFLLVVRYVLRNLDIVFIEEQNQRSIQSAIDLRELKYNNNNNMRPSIDSRFNVMDLTEYNAAMKLGRISIGN